MLLRMCSIGFALAALIVLARVTYYAVAPPPRPAEWIIEGADRDLGTTPVGSHTVEWRVTNRGDFERSILGVAEG